MAVEELYFVFVESSDDMGWAAAKSLDFLVDLLVLLLQNVLVELFPEFLLVSPVTFDCGLSTLFIASLNEVVEHIQVQILDGLFELHNLLLILGNFTLFPIFLLPIEPIIGLYREFGPRTVHKLVKDQLMIRNPIGLDDLFPKFADFDVPLSHIFGEIFIADVAHIGVVLEALNQVLVEVFEVGQPLLAVLQVLGLGEVGHLRRAFVEALHYVSLGDHHVGALQLVVVVVVLLGFVAPLDVLGIHELFQQVQADVLTEVLQFQLEVQFEGAFFRGEGLRCFVQFGLNVLLDSMVFAATTMNTI